VEVVMIERERLNPLKENLRVMTDEDMLLLEKSMRDLGVVEPLHVVEYDGGKYYLIVNGNHRFEVLVKKFAMDKIPCVIIGRDWPMERVYVEAVRLNSISGEFDAVAFVEKIGKIVKRWVDNGMKKTDIALNLGLRFNSRWMKMLLNEGVKKEGEEKKAGKLSDIERLVNSLVTTPVAVFGNFCIIKDVDCVDAIREIMLSADVEGLDGVERLRQILRDGLERGS
jgi:uncharacterized ParB-like nuclease family protein